MEETIALIKSCIISKPGGMPIRSLNYEFTKLVGEGIPYERLGFYDLQSLLTKVNGLKTSRNVFGEQILTVVDPKIKHIAELIKKQKKNYMKTCSKYYKRFTPYSQTYYNSSSYYNNNKIKNDARNKNRNNVWYQDNNRYNQRENAHKYSNRTFSSLHSDSTRYSKHSFFEDYENNNAVVIETAIPKEERIIYEPIAFGHQLIGDDFFLQLAIRNLGLPTWRRAGEMPLHCGLCISGQTIQDCIARLNATECITNRIIIMLGAVDIYNGATCDDLIKDMEELLHLLEQKFLFSQTAITICTIPPLANLSLHGHSNKVKALYSFNDWIRSLAHTEDHSFGSNNSYNNSKPYRIIDFCEAFMDENLVIKYDYFQLNARMVSGCKHPYVLWNKEGRKRAMEMLIDGL